jgi:hypothetical protein
LNLEKKKKKSMQRHFALATLLFSIQKQTPPSFISTTQTDELKEIFVRQNKPEEHTMCWGNFPCNFNSTLFVGEI